VGGGGVCLKQLSGGGKTFLHDSRFYKERTGSSCGAKRDTVRWAVPIREARPGFIIAD